MKRSTAFRFLAALLACGCLVGLLGGCGVKTSHDRYNEQKIEEERRWRETSGQAQTEPSTEAPTPETTQPKETDDPEDPIIPGKWVLTNSHFTQIAQNSTDADGDYVNTYACSLYEHSCEHIYDPEEQIDEEDKPWAVHYTCSCFLSNTEIRPGESLGIWIEAKADYFNNRIFGSCCRIYFDRSWMEEAAVSEQGYDYSSLILYPVHVGTSCGPGYGHALDEPWSDGDWDTLMVEMPIVRQSTLRKHAEFTVQFATDMGNSYFEFTWVPD